MKKREKKREKKIYKKGGNIFFLIVKYIYENIRNKIG